jgi:phosphoketolase
VIFCCHILKKSAIFFCHKNNEVVLFEAHFEKKSLFRGLGWERHLLLSAMPHIKHTPMTATTTTLKKELYRQQQYMATNDASPRLQPQQPRRLAALPQGQTHQQSSSHGQPVWNWELHIIII